ncbi:hypothetical protein PMSD_09825 [Paenibacillus macquariensis subsp. defensor]|nr:hypothetical protein PMSD_09825 [Paenibacillus macquariensis subsp. defensor]
MKMSKRHDLVSYANLSSDLKKEANELLENQKQKLSISFDDVWKLHNNEAAGVNKKRYYSPFVKWSLGIGTATIIFVGSLMGTGFIPPQIANALRNIPFFDYLYSAGGYSDGLIQIQKKKLSTILTGASITDQDIEFRVVEVFYDGIQVVLNYEVNYPDSSPNITDKEASIYYHINFEHIQPDLISTHEFTITGDHSFAGTTLMGFGSSEDLPDKLQLNLSVERIGTTPGKWDVSLPLSKEKSEAITKTIYPYVGFTLNNSKYTVEKLVFGPVSTQLVIKGKFELLDQIGFIIEDDIGTILGGQGGGGGSMNSRYSSFSPLKELNPNPNYITLIMLDNYGIEEVVDRLPLEGTYPMAFKGNDEGKLTVTNIDFQEKQTIVYYDASQPISQLTTIYLENKNGEHISPKEAPIRIAKDSFSFKLVFPEMKETDAANIVAQPYSIRLIKTR